ncbi:hypothetical protein [Nonomuraea guangzhouensis]|uniref:Uncharacterized protein n=1 Tax=Nonomuraea guangzhouensis TaxID=1291555 RepID=A0ABW4GU85_9ACTN
MPTLETLAAPALLGEHLPKLKVRVLPETSEWTWPT